jgi:hypothetical protein
MKMYHPTRIEVSEVLKSHGIDWLTGESDGYSFRGLYDITPAAEVILSDFLGGSVKFEQDAWNGSNGSKHSVLLPHSILPELAVYILLTDHTYDMVCHVDYSAIDCQSALHGFVGSWDDWQEYFDWTKSHNAKLGRFYRGTVSRNQHMMSERVE